MSYYKKYAFGFFFFFLFVFFNEEFKKKPRISLF